MINRISPLQAIKGAGPTRDLPGDAAPAPKARPTELALSASLPKLVNLARELAEQGPPVDHAKIAQVRQAIAQGSYHIDTEKLATAILLYAGTRHDGAVD